MRNAPRDQRGILVFAVLAAGVMATGCNDSPFEYANVEGQVVLDGTPVPAAKVIFMPAFSTEDGEAGPYSQGVTDDEGRYRLETMESDPRSGAVVGPHRVIVTTKQSRLDPDELDREIIDVPESIPWRYTYYKRTPLKFDVPSEGSETADFALQSSPR
ncbi:MAG: hypothetical protein AAGJ46_10780 [Planctomycetota bacterium]